MSNVNLTIGGRNFTVACADGEETHVAMLGKVVDDKLTSMGESAGQTEIRMLLYCSLLLADELHDVKNAAQTAADTAPSLPRLDNGTAARLGKIAEKLENLATHLEG